MRVLIVEDDRDIARLLDVGLGLHNHEVTTLTSNFQQALSDATWTDVDCAVVDLQLPEQGMSGARILAFLLERHPHVRRVVFSAVPHLVPSDVETLADAYLTKPATAAEVAAAIEGGKGNLG